MRLSYGSGAADVRLSVHVNWPASGIKGGRPRIDGRVAPISVIAPTVMPIVRVGTRLRKIVSAPRHCLASTEIIETVITKRLVIRSGSIPVGARCGTARGPRQPR